MYFPVPVKTSSGFETGPTGGRFTDLAPTLDTRCKDGPIRNQLGAGVVVQAVNTSDGYPRLDNIAGTLNCENTTGRGSAQRVDVFVQAVGFDAYNNDVTGDVSKTVDTGQDYHHVPNVLQHAAVRRLTPTECERLQGFPDGYTQVPHRNKPAADGPRYKALGNSMAVPVMHWIGKKIDLAVACQDLI